MIVVVADTSPLDYLIQIHCDHVLPALYERVFVPPAVVAERRRRGEEGFEMIAHDLAVR